VKCIVFLLLSLLLLTPSFACIVDSVLISNVNVSFYNLQLALLKNARYNYFDGKYVYLFSLSNSNIGVRLTNNTIEFAVLKSSNISYKEVNWSFILNQELFWLLNNSVINLSSSILNNISSKGCCHIYFYTNNTLIEAFPRCSEESFAIPLINSNLSLIGVLLSVLPSILLCFYFARKNKIYWQAFFLGCLGWFIASFRSIFIFSIQNTYFLIFISSVLAGVFEESIRYLFFKCTNQPKKNPLLFGLGWGFFEALQIFALTILMYVFLNQPVSFTNSLIGAFERNTATIFHVSMSFFIFKALKNKKFLCFAIFSHFIYDFFATYSYLILNFDVLFLELLLFIISLIFLYYSLRLNKKLLKKIFY